MNLDLSFRTEICNVKSVDQHFVSHSHSALLFSSFDLQVESRLSLGGKKEILTLRNEGSNLESNLETLNSFGVSAVR